MTTEEMQAEVDALLATRAEIGDIAERGMMLIAAAFGDRLRDKTSVVIVGTNEAGVEIQVASKYNDDWESRVEAARILCRSLRHVAKHEDPQRQEELLDIVHNALQGNDYEPRMDG